MRLSALITLALSAALTFGCSRKNTQEPSVVNDAAANDTQRDLEKAFQLHQAGKSTDALKIIRELLVADPQNKHALAIAIDIHASQNDPCQAAEMANDLASTDQANASKILVRAFDWNLKCRNFTEAENNLLDAIESNPLDPAPRRLLAQFFNAQGRRQQASQQVLELLRLGAATHHETLSLIDRSGPFMLASFDTFLDASQPSLFDLGQARMRYVAFNESPDVILESLKPLLTQFPNEPGLFAFFARVSAETGKLQQWQDLIDRFPATTDQHSEYWRALGYILVDQERHTEAIRAFGEAIRIDPTDRQSLRSIAKSLETIGKETEAEYTRTKLAVLDQIFRIAKDADADQSLWISQQLQDLLRPWEAEAWRIRSATQSGWGDRALAELGNRREAILAWEQKAKPEQIRDAALQKLIGFDIRQWPVPDIQIAKGTEASKPKLQIATEQDLRFENVAQSLGIDTVFNSGLDPDSGVFYAYQVNGGGMAAIDYDLDGRCDIYVAQAGGRPNDPFGSDANQLFRLGYDGTFTDVTNHCRTGDRGYGQGICVGDINQDGFPDLIVANIGKNVLYINQGDGTFVDASDRLLDNADRWTSSIGLADLNGDALPEILEINYIDDQAAFQLRCDGEYLPCQPQRFNKALDRIFLANPDGTFRTWNQFDASNTNPKLGFGLVIANFDRQFGNDFFVSNDGDFNHFWSSKPASPSSSGRFELTESAAIRGCSIGRDGSSQACMGIAFGDFNRDSTLDLHVTNFHKESVNLFMQSKAGNFSDEAVKYGLFEPSLNVLGFGTQAADYNNDGWLDLAVLNGHVFDPHDPTIDYRMRPQLFVGGRSGFILHESHNSGQYWQQRLLGRTLVMLDFNRDGRIDLLAGHLDAPVALLQNDSPMTGNWIQFELVGVTSERDAIGCEIQITTNGQTWTNWQIGGDGYMCTNEPIVHFGIGDNAIIEEATINWPSGHIDTFHQVDVNQRWLAIEGDRQLTPRSF